MTIDIKPLVGPASLPFLEELAHLRIQVFREWPYLYEGNLDYEWDYLKAFAAHEQSLLVLALHHGRVVGASTAMPLEAQDRAIQEPWLTAGFEPGHLFYYGESVLQPSYRSQGVGVAFFKEREQHARSQGYQRATFCAVVRPADHPLRPAAYQPLDAFWLKRGFKPTDLYCSLYWQDIDQTNETPKPLRFWDKILD